MRPTHVLGIAYLIAIGLALAGPPAADAQTTVTGHHDNSPTPPGNGDGYDAGIGTYRVPADTGTAQDATFNGNSRYGFLGSSPVTVQGGQFNNNLDGIYAYDNAIVIVNGGQFSGNTYEGIYAYNAPTVTVSGGTFTSNDDGIAIRTGSQASISGGTFSGNRTDGLLAFDGATATVSGGIFSNNADAGLVAGTASTVTVTGGTFGGNTYDFFSTGGTVYLYGQFGGLTPGQTRSLNVGLTSFTGTLQNNRAAQTYSAYVGSGSIVLRDVAATPEPSVWASLTIGTLGLVGRSVRARRRTQT